MLIGLLLAEPEPGVVRLEVPDLFAAFSLHLENSAPAQPAQELGVEALAALDICDNEVEMMDAPGPHPQMFSCLA